MQTLSRRSREIRAVKVEQEWLSGQSGNTGGACARAQPSTGLVPRQRQLRELPALSTGTETETVLGSQQP